MAICPLMARTCSDPERTVTRVWPHYKLAFRRFSSGLLAAISGEPNPDRILHITQSFCQSSKNPVRNSTVRVSLQ